MCAKGTERGFTLVELLVAAVLLATGLAATAAAFSAATRAQAAARRVDTAARLAEAKMAEIEAAGIGPGSGEGSFEELAEAQPEDAQALAAYNYRWEITEGEAQGLVRAEVSVWDRDEQHPLITLVSYFPAPGEQSQ